jgi:hypothetical protein
MGAVLHTQRRKEVSISNVRRIFKNGFIRRRSFASIPAAIFILAMPAAFAQLERVGPVAAVNGFPAWYQDKSGITLEFCSPTVAAELAGAWCVLTTGDTTAPENINIAGQFADEHFYYLAGAQATTTFGGKAKTVLALEGVYDGNPGSQVVFARMRVVVTGLPIGTYKAYTPYGVVGPITLDGVGHTGDKIFVTQDIGLACLPGQFECALPGSIGPYLLASATTGGSELPPVMSPATGKLYIADPARIGPITGSPVGQNYFRVTSVALNGNETDILVTPTGGAGKIFDFNLAGRLFTGSIPGRVTVDRSTYTSDAIARRVDVFASVFPTTQARLPAATSPSAATPKLAYYHGPCDADLVTGVLHAPAGQVSAPMRTNGHVAWGQSTPSGSSPIPLQVCVEDKTSSTVLEGNVTDDVRIRQADYDSNSGNLTVTATSSDTSTDSAVEFTVAYPGGKKVFSAGSPATVNLQTPPSQIQVASNKGGSGQIPVTTTVLNNPIPLTQVLTAQNLIATTPMENALVLFIPNAGSSGNMIDIVTPPASGTATLNLNTSGLADTITYVAGTGTGGTLDSFTYVLSADCNAPCTPVTSNTATVSINITGTQPAPEAVDDAASATAGIAVTINVLANDTAAINLAINPASVVIATPPANGTATVNPTTGAVTFKANAGSFGNSTFTYNVKDSRGVVSNNATVTVAVNGAPVATNDFAATEPTLPVTIAVLANDTDIDGTLVPASVTIVSAPAGTAVVDAATGSILYTPPTTSIPTDSFTYTVRDNLGAISNVATVVVAVDNKLPIANADSASTTTGVPVVINVVANDTDADGTIVPNSVLLLTQPANGTAFNNANGTITYKSAAGFAGTVSFQYRVFDNVHGSSNAAPVTVVVSNIAPTANNDAATTIAGVPVTVNVLANDTDPDSAINPATVTIAAPPANGTAAVNSATGTITYTPAAGFSGTDTFRYTVNDTFAGVSNQATVTVNMSAAPIAVNDSAITNVAASVVINVLANDLVAGPATVTITAPSIGTAGVNGTTGAVTYTPPATFAGTATFTYRVSVGGISSNIATVTVKVIDPITITKAQFAAGGRTWVVEGRTNARVAGETVTIYVGDTINPAKVVGTTAITNNGTFSLQAPNSTVAPDATGHVSVGSSLGGSALGFTVAIK